MSLKVIKKYFMQIGSFMRPRVNSYFMELKRIMLSKASLTQNDIRTVHRFIEKRFLYFI